MNLSNFFPFILIIVLALTSCGSVQKYPLARFSLSETSGITKVKFETGASRAVRLQPSEDLRANNISSTPIVSESVAPFIKPTFGLLDSVDIETYLGPKQGLYSGVKVQVMGAPMASAGEGNFSIAFKLGYSIYVAAEEIKAGESFATPKLDRALFIDSGYSSAEVLMGYRIIGPLQLTIGYFKDSGRYNLKFKEGSRTTILHEVESIGPTLSLLFQPGLFFSTFSITQGNFKVSNRGIDNSYLNWGLNIGVIF